MEPPKERPGQQFEPQPEPRDPDFDYKKGFEEAERRLKVVAQLLEWELLWGTRFGEMVGKAVNGQLRVGVPRSCW